MSYRNAAAIVADRSDRADQSGGHPPADPEQRMHYAWAKLEKLTLELAAKNGTDLSSIRQRLKIASAKSIEILEGAKEVA